MNPIYFAKQAAHTDICSPVVRLVALAEDAGDTTLQVFNGCFTTDVISVTLDITGLEQRAHVRLSVVFYFFGFYIT